MSGSVNRVILVGNLGKDPEIRSLQSGSRVCNLSIATSESWKDKTSGERKEKTEWHRVVIFNDNLVTVAEKYLPKGAKVYIEGQLETRKWQDQSGQDKYSTEVVIKQFRGELQMLDGRDASDRSGDTSSPLSSPTTIGSLDPVAQAFGLPPLNSGPANSSIDDEIPF